MASGKYDSDDHYIHPETRVLLNKLGIDSQAELDQAETAFVSVQMSRMMFSFVLGGDAGMGFDALCEIHGRLFQDVYEWAGKVRDVDISKGQTRFANCQYLVSEGRSLLTRMERENWLADLPHEVFADRLAFYMGELNVLHPFREGNGRTIREYCRQIAEMAGHRLIWSDLDGTEMVDASIHAFHHDHSLLRDLVLKHMHCCQ